MATILTNAQTSFDFMRAAFGTLPEPCPHTVHLAGVPGAPARPDLLIVDEPFGAPEKSTGPCFRPGVRRPGRSCGSARPSRT